MTNPMPTQHRSEAVATGDNRAMRNPWVLTMLGIIVTVFVVNAIFISLAVSNRPDVYRATDGSMASEGSYIAQRRGWETLGWSSSLRIGDALRVGSPAAFRFAVADERGEPVVGGRAQLVAERPSSGDSDLSVPMTETAPGQYVASLPLTLQGAWRVAVEFNHGEHLLRSPVHRITVAE